MKKYIYALLSGIILLAVSCDDSTDSYNLFPDNLNKVLYIKNSGRQTINLYITSQEAKGSLTVVKAGSEAEMSAQAQLYVLTQAEVNQQYNEVENADYVVLPSGTFEFSENIDMAFTPDMPWHKIDVTFKIKELMAYFETIDNPDAQLVLPLKLVSQQGDSINSTKNILFWQFNFLSPTVTVSVGGVGLDVAGNFKTSIVNKNLDVKLLASLPDDYVSESDFECRIDTSMQWVDKYNIDNGTAYPLLPAIAFSEQKELVFKFAKGQLKSEINFTVERLGLGENTYILPLKLQIPGQDDVRYLLIDNRKYGIARTNDRASWEVLFCNNDELFSGSSYEWDRVGPYAFLDDDMLTYWHSNWSGAVTGSDDYVYDWTRYLAYNPIIPSGKKHWHAFSDMRSTANTCFVIDFGKVKAIAGIGIVHRMNATHTNMRKMEIYLSDDPQFLFTPGQVSDYNNPSANNWKKALTFSNIPAEDGKELWYDLPYENVEQNLAEGVKGRFMKIHLMESSDASPAISEFFIKEIVTVNGEPLE